MANDKPKLPSFLRRQAFAEKQVALGKGLFHGREPLGSGPPNRHGLPKLPPGQKPAKNWPVLDLGSTPDIAQSSWTLAIDGEVSHPISLNWGQFMALPQTDDVSDFHCVTTWSRMDIPWTGVRFSDLMAVAKPYPEAAFVLTTGYDVDPSSGESYTTNLALAEAMKLDVLLVHTAFGAPLAREHGGPCRMITPQLYAWKGAKWIHKITLLSQSQLGFWERRGYSDTAHPWFEDRYAQH